jgi:hypothetical protein
LIKNIIVISDTHSGCRFAVCPPNIILDGGIPYQLSELQKTLLVWWNEFWDEWVPMVTKDEDYIIVHNGDAIEGVHHRAITPITQNFTDQQRIAKELLYPIVTRPHCKQYFHLRGTEAHSGSSGQYEEKLAEELGAEPDALKQFARWELWLEFGENNSLAHFTHHIANTSSNAYEGTAVTKELVESYVEAGRWNLKPPDVVVRSHRHRQFEQRIATAKGYGISIITPAWQCKTPFSFRIGLGRSSTPQIGGYLIRTGDEDHIYTRFKIWNIARDEIVTV